MIIKATALFLPQITLLENLILTLKSPGKMHIKKCGNPVEQQIKLILSARPLKKHNYFSPVFLPEYLLYE